MTDENIYYNFNYNNTTNTDQPAVITQTRVQNILDIPSNYKLSVVRFSVPAINIPVQNKFKENYYYIKMRYDGAEILSYLTHIPNAFINLGRIWNYQEFVDIINVALLSCYTQLKILKPAMPQNNPPICILNSTLEKIEFYFPTTYDTTILNNTEVIFNNKLYYICPTISSFAGALDLEFRIIVKNNLINIITINAIQYYIISEENGSLFLINTFDNISFQSDSLPINPELIGTQKNITRRILTDFEPSKSAINNRSTIQYFPQGPLRWIDLYSANPLRNTDLKIYWTTKDNDEHLVYIPAGDTLTVKLLFRKINADGTFNYT
jgi:hypothetical protein